MANRIIFEAKKTQVGVLCRNIEFEYFAGFALSQKQKTIDSLHERAKEKNIENILEISTASKNELGIALSAFNLMGTVHPFNNKVELNFQSSKVFENGGPYKELLNVSCKEAKLDKRLKQSGKLIKFEFNDTIFKNEPLTYFYDWLYINSLLQNESLVKQLISYDAFSDIAFNNEKSINCQAYSAALFKSITNCNIDCERLSEPEYFLHICNKEYENRWINSKFSINK